MFHRSVASSAHSTSSSLGSSPSRSGSQSGHNSITLGGQTRRRKAGLSSRRRKGGRRYAPGTTIPLSEAVCLLVTAVLLVACGVTVVVKILLSRGFSVSVNRSGSDAAQQFLNSMANVPKALAKKAMKKTLPWNALYRHSEAHPLVGDRSDRYAKLRQEVDPLFPEDSARSLGRVHDLVQYTLETMAMDIHNSDTVPYDIYNCPDKPPAGYPFAWPMMDVLGNWPIDDYGSMPTQIHNGLCVFDFDRDYHKAMAYRNAELPFVVINDPEVAKTVERWNSHDDHGVPYPERLMRGEQHRTEVSVNNHFMYYAPPGKGKRPAALRKRAKVPENWTEPTSLTKMMYKDWVKHANVTDDMLGPDQKHWYYRLIGCGLPHNDGACDHGFDTSEYLFDELPFFQPKENLYLREPEEQNGIHCRFGMKGVIAENHFDGSRNSIVVLGGSRRYILAHPAQCDKLTLYPKGHPSARHSEIDWSDPDLEQFPEFEQARANEVVLQAGQVLYLPTHWFHFIVSLELNWQCNTRSGIGEEYKAAIRGCGF